MAAIGIDLGTTNSLVCAYIEGELHQVPNALGDLMTPSVVAIDESQQLIVGKAAKHVLTTEPECAVGLFKTHMGTAQKYTLSKKEYCPEELSALVLMSLKSDVDRFLPDGESIESLVISVPAYFNNAQRASVKNAAKIAGLDTSKLISEPTAAALSYGLNNMASQANFIVLDLGGGTFDVSLMEVFEGIFDVKASSGNNRLGGEDFLDVLVDEVIRYFHLEKSLISQKELESLRNQCENLKVALSQSDYALMPFTIKGDTYTFKYTNEEFERIAKALLDKFSRPVAQVLKNTHTAIVDLDFIVFVGGASRMRIFNKHINSFFPNSKIISYEPDHAVVKGAALQAYLELTPSGSVREYVVSDVCPYSMGVDCYDDDLKKTVMSPIIERYTPLPITKVHNFLKMQPDQREVNFEIYQGENLDPKKNLHLGTINFDCSKLSVDDPMATRFTYDSDGILNVEVSVEKFNLSKNLLINKSGISLSPLELQEKRRRLEKLKVLPREQQVNKVIVANLESVFQQSVGKERESAKNMLVSFSKAMEQDSQMVLEKAKFSAEKFLGNYSFTGSNDNEK